MSRSSRLPVAILFAFLMGALLAVAPAADRPAQALDASCWTGTWEHYPRLGPMWLAQNGSSVSGSYDWDYGRLSGVVEGDTLRGQWSEWPTYAPPVDAGSFVFTISPDCRSFSGIYNYGSEDEWQDWSGDRIDGPGRVAARVVEPAVSYRGLEYQPGDTFFPDTCTEAARDNGSEPCENTLEFRTLVARITAARALASCVYDKISRVIAIVEQAQLAPDEEALVLAIAIAKGYEKCAFGSTRATAELGLELRQGVARINGLAPGQTISVDVQLATATSSGPGSFVAGYHPQTNEALFIAYSAPLSVTPLNGSTLVLPPFHAVELTPDGFGPLDELSRLYVPMVVAPGNSP